jgi:hypothetical protein
MADCVQNTNQARRRRKRTPSNETANQARTDDESQSNRKGRFRKRNRGERGNPFARRGSRLRQVVPEALKQKAMGRDVVAIRFVGQAFQPDAFWQSLALRVRLESLTYKSANYTVPVHGFSPDTMDRMTGETVVQGASARRCTD